MMRNLISVFALLTVTAYTASAFGVGSSHTVTCTPVDDAQKPSYEFVNAGGAAPGVSVAMFKVTRTQPGFSDITSKFDLLKDPETKAYGGLAPFQVGSAFLFAKTFFTIDSAKSKWAPTGYINVFIRKTQGLSVIDIQLPQDAENAGVLNTTPPVSGYACTSVDRG